MISERLEKAQGAPELDISALSMDEQRARQQVSDLQQQLETLTRQTRSGGTPRLIVLDGNTGER